jgi:hypothetical protein
MFSWRNFPGDTTPVALYYARRARFVPRAQQLADARTSLAVGFLC